MSTSKRTSTSKKSSILKKSRTTLNPDTAYLQFLRNPDLAHIFVKFSSQDVHQERFVKFQDYSNYDISNLFETAGLYNLLAYENRVPSYPFLVRLLYTNLNISYPPQIVFLKS